MVSDWLPHMLDVVPFNEFKPFITYAFAIPPPVWHLILTEVLTMFLILEHRHSSIMLLVCMASLRNGTPLLGYLLCCEVLPGDTMDVPTTLCIGNTLNVRSVILSTRY